MTRAYAVIRQAVLPAGLESCWPFLSDRMLVASWFADVDRIEAGRPFRFDFGDGDFFSGTIDSIELPTSLSLTWRFMGVGAPSRITFYLAPSGSQTEITVVDCGEYTDEGLADLREGWVDFLGRLETRIRTGQLARYLWSPEISTGALLDAAARPVPLLARSEWWTSAFPGASVSVESAPAAAEIRAAFSHPDWDGVTTCAVVRCSARRDGLGVSVRHSGWDALPAPDQVTMRSHFATLWAEALRGLEARLRPVGTPCCSD
jgi:uncharacterized protein YndB with AHSA1/START domain